MVCGLGLSRAFGHIRPIFRERGKINAEVTGRLTESLAGVRVSALAAVNAVGDVRDPRTGVLIAGARRSPESMELADTEALMKRGLRPCVRQGRVGVRRHEQEHLRPQAPGADAGHVREQLIAAQAERAHDPARERMAGQMTGFEGHDQLSSRPPTRPPIRPPPSRCEFPAAPSLTGPWK